MSSPQNPASPSGPVSGPTPARDSNKDRGATTDPSVRESLVERARSFGVHAHKRIDQRRRYTGQPYDVHLRAVAELVAGVTDDPEICAAAWLHDVVEDTPATFDDIRETLGPGVADLVAEVTDVSRPTDGNRAARKAIDRAHLAEASPRGKTVKLADLIDNTRDICQHDPRFARVYVREAHSLLDVLREGDATLWNEARRAIEDGARELDIDLEREEASGEFDRSAAAVLGPESVWRMFAQVFRARDIAEPLRSFDGDRDAGSLGELLRSEGLDDEIVGVRDATGRIAGYARVDELERGELRDVVRDFARDQRLSDRASLSSVIRTLTRHEFGFVTQLGEVTAFVTRQDIQKPIVRMWLFGMITLTEMTLADRMREQWPDGSWVELISEGRLEKARELRDERRRRGQRCDLIDCLQLSDKADVLARSPEQLAVLGFESRKAAGRVIKEFVSLRNNLAHAQDIVTHDWAQIARMTGRVEELLASDPGEH